MRKLIIPLGIATFLLLTGFGVFQVARNKNSAGRGEELIIDSEIAEVDVTEIANA